MTSGTTTRHRLMMQECDCGTCPPTWVRRRGKSRRYTEPVTLVGALEFEEAASRPGMVENHRTCLLAMVCEVDRVLKTMSWDDLGHPEAGLALVMFAGELASAVRHDEFRVQLPPGLVADCEQTVTAATQAAAECLAEVVDGIRSLVALE